MEFLIFVFVIVSILSSLNDWAKKNREKKREKFFDPWSFERDSQIERLKKIGKKEDSFKKTSDKTKTSLSKDEISAEVREKEEYFAEHFVHPKEKRVFISSPIVGKQKTKKKIDQSILSKKDEKEDILSPPLPDSFNLRKEVAKILSSSQLPQAILISEILGPPRAFKPHKINNYKKFN